MEIGNALLTNTNLTSLSLFGNEFSHRTGQVFLSSLKVGSDRKTLDVTAAHLVITPPLRITPIYVNSYVLDLTHLMSPFSLVFSFLGVLKPPYSNSNNNSRC